MYCILSKKNQKLFMQIEDKSCFLLFIFSYRVIYNRLIIQNLDFLGESNNNIERTPKSWLEHSTSTIRQVGRSYMSGQTTLFSKWQKWGLFICWCLPLLDKISFSSNMLCVLMMCIYWDEWNLTILNVFSTKTNSKIN